MEVFAKLTKCMVNGRHALSLFLARRKLYIINSFKIAEEERLAIHYNLTVDSVTS